MSLKSMSARLGHIKRKLSNEEPLKKKSLELALDVIDDLKKQSSNNDPSIDKIRDKLILGHPLDEYEYHCFVEGALLRYKIDNL